jgi:hypothetical protein
MSPTATALVLLLALVVDYMSVGPNSIRDRIAFLLAVPAIREGFNGSPLDGWTVDLLRSGDPAAARRDEGRVHRRGVDQPADRRLWSASCGSTPWAACCR